jgi:hypothetical protein
MTVQEKVRRANTWKYVTRHDVEPEFTQEYKNAVGTTHEEPGEWFHLWAQLYFFGWCSPTSPGLAAWLLMDVVRYKILVYYTGGLSKMGIFRKNRKHGAATFYAIPVSALRKAIIWSEGLDKWLSDQAD